MSRNWEGGPEEGGRELFRLPRREERPRLEESSSGSKKRL